MRHIQEDYQLFREAENPSESTASGLGKDFSDILFLAMEFAGVEAGVLMFSERKESWKTFVRGIDPERIHLRQEQLKELLSFGNDRILSSQELSGNGVEMFSGNFPFFLAIPVMEQDLKGKNEGLLFLLSKEAIKLSDQQERALVILVHQILKSVESVQQKEEYERVQQALEQKYHDLERFASVVSHDIKSPLANIISLTELLKEENKGKLSGETLQYLDFLEESSQSLRNYVDGLLIFYRSEKILDKEEEDVQLGPFFKEITRLYAVDPAIDIRFPEEGILRKVNRAALSQIFMNLLGNALKYNFNTNRKVTISYEQDDEYYSFCVRDNGRGIPEDQLENIFDLFSTLEQNDRNGNLGSGIGLATVKKLVENMGGSISVESVEGKGSAFSFTIKR